ncbi:hypothetical protein THRCLA_23293 [Thraustotheca clavata]|uniref:Uncharacterized protein n=1 Tax=Thraustotheca clavata TaxID=74557 RepID=A0A1V9Y7Y6_9STRA|nr:hypothetical protein THRCLA_23293 [Thraustotheca clavata]
MGSVVHLLPDRYVMPTKDEIDELCHSMGEAQVEEAKLVKLKNVFESSATHKEAESKPVFTAILGNFKSHKTPLDIVNFLKRCRVHDVIRCEIRTPNKQKPRSKMAIDSMGSQASLDIVIGLSTKRWDGLALYTQEEKDPLGSVMHILPSNEGAQYFNARFSSKKMSPCLLMGEVLEFKIADVEQCRIGITTEGNTVVWFKLHPPPLCYTSSIISLDDVDSDLDDKFGGLITRSDVVNVLRSLSAVKSTCTDKVWELEDTAEKLSDVDHSPRDVLTIFRKFGMVYVEYRNTSQVPLRSALNQRLPQSDWSGGFDRLLEPLSFPIRYILQVLLSHHYIEFSHANQVATLVVKILVSKVKPEDILILYYGKCGNGWYKLLNIIESRTKSPSIPAKSNGMQVRLVLIVPLCIVAEPPEHDVSN